MADASVLSFRHDYDEKEFRPALGAMDGIIFEMDRLEAR